MATKIHAFGGPRSASDRPNIGVFSSTFNLNILIFPLASVSVFQANGEPIRLEIFSEIIAHGCTIDTCEFVINFGYSR